MISLSALQSLIVAHLWQSVLVAALLAALLILGKRMSGRVRYSLAASALALGVLLPAGAFLPRDGVIDSLMNTIGAPPAADSSVSAPVASDGSSGDSRVGLVLGLISTLLSDGEAAASVASAPPTAPAAAPSAWTMPDLTLPFLTVWSVVSLFLIVRIGKDIVAVERLVMRARRITLPSHLARRLQGVPVAVSAEAPGPMAAGLLNPCVVLPESMAVALDAPGVAALLEHEHAHIRRNDMLAAVGQRVLVALLWWSPAIHWISRRMDEEREVACDEAAVERTGDAKAFAISLTSQAENQLWARAPRLAVGAIGPRSHLGRRVRRLIDIAKRGVTSSRYSGRVAFAALVLVAGVAIVASPRISADTPPDGSREAWEHDVRTQDFDAGRIFLAQAPAPPQPPGARVLPPVAPVAPVIHDREISGLVAEIMREVEMSLADIGPELDSELAGISLELAGLGGEIAMLVNQEVMRELPQIMEEVRLALEEADQNGDFDNEEFRQDMEEMRQELNESLGPEFREELRQSLAEARAEIAAHRNEIRIAMRDKKPEMEAVREAMREAREEIRAARERGDFDHGFHFDFDFDKDFDVDAMIKDMERQGVLDGGKSRTSNK